MYNILAEQTESRISLENWLLSNDHTDKFDSMCHADCKYACKLRWRFAGLVGASGTLYQVGPMCHVLWKFSPRNPLAWNKSETSVS